VARPAVALGRAGRFAHSARAPFAALAVVVLVWSIGPLLNRGMHARGTVAGFYRMWLAVPAAFAVARWRRTPVTWAHVRASAPAGVLFVTAYITSYEALHRTTVANASLIGALQPVLVMLAAYPIFGERFGRIELGWSAVALTGIGVFVVSGSSGGHAGLIGDLFAVGNLLLWSCYFIEMKRRRGQVPVAAFLCGVFLTGAVAITPYALLTGAPVGGIEARDLGLMGLMVILPGMMGHGLMTWVQRHVDVGLSAMLTLSSTVLSALGAWLLFGQSLTAVQVLGGALVLAALAALLQHRTRGNPVGSSEEAVL